MMPLTLLAAGEQGEIVQIRDTVTGPAAEVRMEELGLRVGKIVEMLNRGGSVGPVLLKVDESRIAVARSATMRILVRRVA